MAIQMQFCMDGTNSDWLKDIIPDEGPTDSSEELLPCPLLRSQAPLLERRLRPPHDHQSLKCPRCASAHTKFCYYNNYSLSQPRYFCKTCRRYWTKGGTLRNVPVGGGCRKNKRPSTSKKSPPMGADDQIPEYPTMATDLHLSNLNFIADHFGTGGGFDTCQRLLMPFGGGWQEKDAAVEVKPDNRMLSLEWPDQGCGTDSFGYSNGLGLWAGMLSGNGSSSAAM